MDERDLLPHHPRPCDRTLTIPPLSKEVSEILVQHGCSFRGSSLTLPEGTTQAEILPRCYAARFKLTFPDGYEIGEHLERSGISALYLPASDVPDQSNG